MIRKIINLFQSELSKYDTYPDKNFDEIEHFLEGKQKIISNDKIKSHLWSALINIIIVFPVFLILSPITGIMPAVSIVIHLLIFSAITQVGLLNSSKWLAIKSNKIRVLSEDTVKNDTERQLLRIIEKISKIAGLVNPPDVGIWRSEEMNAFATGRNRNNAIIAFSSSLIYHMDEDAIAAVAAHELSHIVTGDMKTSTIVQSAMDAIIVFFTLPFTLFISQIKSSKQICVVEHLPIVFIRFIISSTVTFMADLFAKKFSREREFRADRLASEMIDAKRMIHALRSLSLQKPVKIQEKQLSYASLKIFSQPKISELLSTHPSIEKRIAALEKEFFKANSCELLPQENL